MVRSRCGSVVLVALAVASLGLITYLQADNPSVDKLNRKITNFTLTDAAAEQVSLHDFKDRKAIVVVFVSFECPVATSYLPVLADLHKVYADKGVAFLAINTTEDLTPAQLAAKAAEYHLPFPVLKDVKDVARNAFKAEYTPEAFVLDGGHVLRYRGRIDNTWAARLKKNPEITQHDLKRALDEMLANKEVSVTSTKPVGCPILRDKETAKTGTTSYYRDVVPILQTHCQQCHRPGEVGPFSLMTYHQAVTWAEDIKSYTQEGKMPPWKPVEGQRFHNERRLTDGELKTLARWVEEGTPEGDPKDAPPARKFVEGWYLGQPDMVLTAPGETTVGASGRDHFRVLVLPTGLTEDRYVTAVEVRPGNPRVLHHTLNFFDRSGEVRKLEQKEKERKRKPEEVDAGPGYPVSMGVGFSPKQGDLGGLGGWAPGQLGRRLPEGTGYLLPKGSDVIVQMHYHRTGRVEHDRTSIGLYFAKKPVEKVYQGAVIRGDFLYIDANAERFPVRGAIQLEQDMRLHSVMPHMHMLGREIKVTITPPEGKPYTLVAIKDWDYNWQETYFLKEPIDLKAGTILSVQAFYNNTDKNPNNPFHPARPVIFGEQTDNEMCFVFLGGTSDNKGGRIRFKRVQTPKPAAEKN